MLETSGHGAKESGPGPADVQGRRRVRNPIWMRKSPPRLGGSLSTSPKRDIITLLPPAAEMLSLGLSARQSPPKSPSARRGHPRRNPSPARRRTRKGKSQAKNRAKAGSPPSAPRVDWTGRVTADGGAGYFYWDHSSHFEVRRTTRLLRRASLRSRPRSRATSPRFRLPTMSMSTEATWSPRSTNEITAWRSRRPRLR